MTQFLLGFAVGGVVVGGIVAGVILNNKAKALAVLQAGKEAIEKELAKYKT
jgi:hypothetical protein